MINAMSSVKGGLVLCVMLLAWSCTGNVIRMPLELFAMDSFEVSSVCSDLLLSLLYTTLKSLSYRLIAHREKSPTRFGKSSTTYYCPWQQLCHKKIKSLLARLATMASRWVPNQLTSNYNQTVNTGCSPQRDAPHDLIYCTEVDIGTPPQRLLMLLDISYPETFVSSINCKVCDIGDARYDSSRSSSAEVSGTSLEVDSRYWSASGNMTTDTFGIFGYKIQNQPFLEATRVMPARMSWDDMKTINGVVGLTPSNAGSALNNPSPFMSMVKEKLLDRNLFSMRLRKPREIIFGAIDPKLFTGELVQLPLTKKTNHHSLTGRWQTEARYLTLGSDPGIQISLDGYSASFSTGSAFILLPGPMALNILDQLQFEDPMFLPPSVPCERRKIMPDLPSIWPVTISRSRRMITRGRFL